MCEKLLSLDRSISNLFYKSRQSGSTPQQFWNILQTIKDRWYGRPRDFPSPDKVMDRWLAQDDYPVIYVERNYDRNVIWLYQKSSRADYSKRGTYKNNWWIPISYTAQSILNFYFTIPQFWMKPYEVQSIYTIDVNDWIILNLQQTGKRYGKRNR